MALSGDRGYETFQDHNGRWLTHFRKEQARAKIYRSTAEKSNFVYFLNVCSFTCFLFRFLIIFIFIVVTVLGGQYSCSR